jgi:hypothetical protein
MNVPGRSGFRENAALLFFSFADGGALPSRRYEVF